MTNSNIYFQNTQARPPVPGVQTIGIIGSMGPGSQLRPGGATSLQQQRSTQPPALSQAPPANSSLPSQVSMGFKSLYLDVYFSADEVLL